MTADGLPNFLAQYFCPAGLQAIADEGKRIGQAYGALVARYQPYYERVRVRDLLFSIFALSYCVLQELIKGQNAPSFHQRLALFLASKYCLNYHHPQREKQLFGDNAPHEAWFYDLLPTLHAL